jgi:hypothetical protein
MPSCTADAMLCCKNLLAWQESWLCFGVEVCLAALVAGRRTRALAVPATCGWRSPCLSSPSTTQWRWPGE